MVSLLRATALCHSSGTRPRLANSSSTRGITPGSARACREKKVVVAVSAAATVTAGDDIDGILGKRLANQHGPGPRRARVGNSPNAGAMCRPQHGRAVYAPPRRASTAAKAGIVAQNRMQNQNAITDLRLPYRW